jgi:hypothetical protein
MADIAIEGSPFGCRWILDESESREGQRLYALCLRARDQARIVSESECAICRLWETKRPNHPENGHQR